MPLTNPRRRWPGLRGKRSQAGQALIYGLFVLIGGLAALYFLFNAGQLSREKTKLVNAADAVAYSAGLMHARTLNFEAYTNRAMMANTVAIAQLVSLSSWIKYADNMGSYGIVLENEKFEEFSTAYHTATYLGPYLQEYLNDSGTLEQLATTSDSIIRRGLMTAQQVAYAGLVPARKKVMDEVAQANYAGDGSVAIDLAPLTGDEFTAFVTRYSGDERTRFAETVKVAANRDSFVPRRSWWMPGTKADCEKAFPRVDWLERRGGTELLGFDEWKAMDTLSEWRWVPKNKADTFCVLPEETPAGWGSTSAADESSVDLDPTHYDYALPINPKSSVLAIATSESWDYSGLPNFYDLSEDARKQDDPRLRFAIRVRRGKGQTLTSEGRSAIGATKRLNQYKAEPAGGSELVAVAASEVFFERENDVKDNVYGMSLGKPREIGSLFNPFWQVHLIQSDVDVHKAQAMQGAFLP